MEWEYDSYNPLSYPKKYCIVMNENELYGVDPTNLYKLVASSQENQYFNSSHFYRNDNGKFTYHVEKFPRTVGMAANRIIDRHIDARNPRNASRHLPSGKLKLLDMIVLTLLSLGVFFFAAAQLNTLALILAPVAIAYLVFYPFTKRFTWTANLLLGWALAISPSAAWIGVTGSLTWQPVLLSLAVALWAGSFDILYHTQDREFHIESGLHSVAKQFGIVRAFQIARILDRDRTAIAPLATASTG